MKPYVGNFSFDMQKRTLRELFEPFGTVSEVKLITDRETGQSRGFGSLRWAMFRKVTRQSGVSMERIMTAANSRLMRLAQKMIVAGALPLDRVANSDLHRSAPLRSNCFFKSAVFSRDRISRTTVAWSPSNGQAVDCGHSSSSTSFSHLRERSGQLTDPNRWRIAAPRSVLSLFPGPLPC